MTRQLQPCGTTAAYQRHKRARETPCQPCREAHNAYVRELRNSGPRGGPGSNQKVAPCGTKSARQRHRRRGESCEVCDAAKQARQAAAAAKSGTTRRTTPEPLPKRRVTRNRDVGTAPWMYGPIPTLNPHTARQAALTTCEHAQDTDDARLLLDALGILPILRDTKAAA